MEKVGIITHYYRSQNYGGTLQAYALQRVVAEMGYEAQQLCYNMAQTTQQSQKTRKLKNHLKRIRNRLLYQGKIRACQKRTKEFFRFQESVPHSEMVYNRDTIGQAAEDYDSFITGSDQVWNTDWYHSAYFLDFVPAGKKKIAYAASLGRCELTEKDRKVFSHSLQDYAAISVREDDAVELVGQCTEVSVVKTLDPTMLLSAEQWDVLCAEPMIDEPYLFCFLLGDDKQNRDLATKIARKKGLKLVTLPQHFNSYEPTDKKKGDIALYDVSPAQFISLIKNAHVVYTDSFHASVFSALYHREFYALERKKSSNMRSRVVSLTEFYQCEDHFLPTSERLCVEYIEGLHPIDYKRTEEKLKEEQNRSIEYLRKALEYKK